MCENVLKSSKMCGPRIPEFNERNTTAPLVLSCHDVDKNFGEEMMSE